jgi:hypothetical protein
MYTNRKWVQMVALVLIAALVVTSLIMVGGILK